MKLFKSKAGFTLIELLVVIGILAVLAAIAIPSVAGLIDRANVSADKTNANEMTNAVERFCSEYELYCQDIASGAIKDADSNGVPDDMDAAQGRVFNVTGAITRSDITALESTGLNGKQINRDTKYPVDAATMQAVVENYTKTSSATFEPKQSDMHYWYSPDCGVVVFAEPNADQDKENKLNNQIISGMDAKGNQLSASTQWIDLTLGAALSGGNNVQNPIVVGSVTFSGKFKYTYDANGIPECYGVGHHALEHNEGCFDNDGTTLTWEELKDPANGVKYGYDASAISDTAVGYAAFRYCANLTSVTLPSTITKIDDSAFMATAISNINLTDCANLSVIAGGAFEQCRSIDNVVIPNSVSSISGGMFWGSNIKTITIPNSVIKIEQCAFESSNIENIIFQGTKSQWNSISLQYAWNSYCSDIVVTCTDGTITIPAN